MTEIASQAAGSKSDEVRFLFKHSTIYGIGTMLSRAVAFLLLPLYTRYLTVSDYGVMELIDVTTGLIGIVVGLGIEAALSRFYYEFDDQHERNVVVSTVYGSLVICSGVVIALSMAVSPFLATLVLNSGQYTYYFRIAFTALLVGVFADLGQSYLRMHYKSVLFITLSTASLIVGVSLNVFFIVHMRIGVLGILYTSLITRTLVMLPLTAAILYWTGFTFSTRHAVALFRYSLPLLPSTLGTALMNYSDRYFIKHFSSIADAGVYGLANKVGGSLHMLITAPFIMTFLPRRFQIVHDRTDAREVFVAVFDCFFFALLLLSLVVAVFTPEIMITMTTPPFYRAGDLVPIILLGMLIFGMKYQLDFGILQSQQTKYYFYANALTAAVQLGAALVLISQFGIWGAALASLTSVTVNATLLHLFARRLYPIPFNFTRNAKLLTVAGGVYLLARQLSGFSLATALGLKIVLLTGFVVALPFLGLVSDAEVMQLRTLIVSVCRRLQAGVPPAEIKA